MVAEIPRAASAEERCEATLREALVADLEGLVATPELSPPMRAAVGRFRQAGPAEQRATLPTLYLLFEHYLSEVDPVRTVPRPTLRARVEARFGPLLADPAFGLLFEPEARQEGLLCRRFLLDVIDRAGGLAGAGGEGLIPRTRAWLEAMDPEAESPLGGGGLVEVNGDGLVLALIEAGCRLFAHLEGRLGEAAERVYEVVYAALAERYVGLDTFPVVVRLLPERMLDDRKIQLLSRRQVHRVVLDQVHHLEAVNARLAESNRDLTRARAEAEATSALYRAVLATAGDALVSIDAAGAVVAFNAEAERVFGYAQEEMLGRSLGELMPPEYRARHEAGLRRYVETGQARVLGRRVELEGLHRDGTRFPLEICITETRLRDASFPDSERLFFTASLRDVTERKRHEAELVEARERAEEMLRLKGTFLANMSHEIRTPLTGIIGFSEVLEEELAGSEYQEFACLIGSGGRRLLATLNDVLDLAKLESESVELELRELDAVAEVEAVADLLRPLARRRGIELRVEAEAPALPVVSDAASLGRILNNLIGNAIKFTEEGGVTVRVGARAGPPGGTRLRLEIEDTGIGMDAAFLPHLFAEFRQASTGHGRSHEGTGLGMTISKRLLDLLGGEIAVWSEPGTGTRFTITLPSAAAGGDGASAAGAPAAHVSP